MSLRSVVRPLFVILVAGALAGLAATAGAEPSRTGEGPVRFGGAPSVNPSVDPPVSSSKVVVPMAFPVIGYVTYTDTFLACRGTGCSRRHLGQDVMGRKMMPLIATFSGTVTSMSRDGSSGNYVSIRSLDGVWTVNYLHVNNDTPGTDDGRGTAKDAFLPGLRVGAKVVRGQLVGWLGDSGNAEGTSPHLHFELRRGDAWSGTVYNPYPSLKAASRQTSYVVAAPHQPGELIAWTGGRPYLLTADGGRQLVPPSMMAVHGWTADDIVTVTGAEFALYADRGTPALRNGSVVAAPDGIRWATTGGRRYQVTTTDLTAMGLTASAAMPVTAEALVGTPAATGAVPGGKFRAGAFVRESSSSQVWLIEGGKRRAISTGGWPNWSIGPSQVAVLPNGALSAAGVPPVGTLMGYRDGTLFRSTQGTFIMVAGVRRPILDLRALTYYNWVSKRYLYMYPNVTAALPLGAAIA